MSHKFPLNTLISVLYHELGDTSFNDLHVIFLVVYFSVNQNLEKDEMKSLIS